LQSPFTVCSCTSCHRRSSCSARKGVRGVSRRDDALRRPQSRRIELRFPKKLYRAHASRFSRRFASIVAARTQRKVALIEASDERGALENELAVIRTRAAAVGATASASTMHFRRQRLLRESQRRVVIVRHVVAPLTWSPLTRSRMPFHPFDWFGMSGAGF
jgi:hypothetical protein